MRVSDLGAATPDESNDNINFQEIWRVLRRRKRLVLVTAFSVIGLTAVTTIHERLFKPVYRGSFTLLISDPINPDNQERFGRAGGSGGLIEQVARNSASTDVPTLIVLLKSQALLKPVYARNPQARANLTSLEIDGGSGKFNTPQGILKVSITGVNRGLTKALLDDLANTYIRTALVQRQQRLADGIAFLNRQAPSLERKSAELQEQLSLFRQRHTVLDPAAEGASLRAKMVGQTDGILTLQEQRSKLLNVRQAILNGTLTASSYQEAIAGLGGSSGGGGASRGGSGGGGLSVVNANQSLLEQLTKLDGQLAEARAKFTPSSSMLKGLEARRQRLMPILRQSQLEAVAGALQANQLSLAVARQQQGQLNAIFLGKPQLIKEYETLQQKLTIANTNLASLLQAKENFQLEIAQKTVPWKVIAPVSVSGTPIKPSVPRNLAVGVLLGLVAGAGAGLLRDRLDHVFHSPGEVNVDLKQTLLGHIPHVEFFQGVREDSRFLIEELDPTPASSAPDKALDAEHQIPGAAPKTISGYQRFFYQEAFRNLFTSLRFLDSDRPLRAIALTSAVPNEGKSLVNVLLAKTLSEMGKRVLLIDADMRKPQLHYRLGLNNLVGLSNILTEDNIRWSEAVQSVKNHEGWSVITSGRRPPDPTRLLSSARMHQLAQEISQSGQFDLVIYDTPPVLGLADAMLTSEHVDGLILLVSLDQVDRQLPKEAIKRIQASKASLLGLVTNAIKPESAQADGYGYGYGYGYEYYQSDSELSGDSPEAQQKAALPLWRQRLKSANRKVVRWIDR